MDIYESVTRFYESTECEKTEIGKSLFGHTMYALKVGNGRPVGLVQYAMHGREFITAKLAFEQYKTGVKKGSCWFLPLTNPDGVLLSEVGLDSVQKEEDKMRLLALNGEKRDFHCGKRMAGALI